MLRASGDATTLEVDGADTTATVKEKFDTALLESDQEPAKGLSLWHENTRLYESGTLQSYGIGAGAEIQALMTEHDVKAALREEREAKEMDRAEAERKFGWEMNYGCCISKAEGERRRRKALEQARRALEPARQIARDLAQLGPAQLKAKYDTVRTRARARARAPLVGRERTRARRPDARRPSRPPVQRELGALECGVGRQDGGRPSIHRYGVDAAGKGCALLESAPPRDN